jgi:hypothetical protein
MCIDELEDEVQNPISVVCMKVLFKQSVLLVTGVEC